MLPPPIPPPIPPSWLDLCPDYCGGTISMCKKLRDPFGVYHCRQVIGQCLEGCRALCMHGCDNGRICGFRCVDTNKDKSNCGGCGIKCKAPEGGSAFCKGGICQQKCDQPGFMVCGDKGKCINIKSDLNNCGHCDTPCPPPIGGTPKCVGGICEVSCSLGYTKCGSACVDTLTDNNNCGGCG